MNYFVAGIETSRSLIEKKRIEQHNLIKTTRAEKETIMAESFSKQMEFQCNKCNTFTISVCNDCDAFYCQDCFNHIHQQNEDKALEKHHLSKLDRKVLLDEKKMKSCEIHERDMNSSICNGKNSQTKDSTCLFHSKNNEIESDGAKNVQDCGSQCDKLVSFEIFSVTKFVEMVCY